MTVSSSQDLRARRRFSEVVAAMVTLYADAEITIDVVEEPTSDALSLETECGLRFVLRQGAGGPTR